MENRIIDAIVASYLEAAAFTDFGPDGEIPSDSEFSPEAIEAARADCVAFLQACSDDAWAYIRSGRVWDHFGHDFWLTRNHHGVGFWDRGLGDLGERLTSQAHKAGEKWAYLGDDGLVYFD